MAVFFWHYAVSVAVSLGVYTALHGGAIAPDWSPLLLALLAGYAAGAVAYLVRCLILRAGRWRTERRLRRSWWTPEQMVR
jgi:hypothetical protein